MSAHKLPFVVLRYVYGSVDNENKTAYVPSDWILRNFRNILIQMYNILINEVYIGLNKHAESNFYKNQVSSMLVINKVIEWINHLFKWLPQWCHIIITFMDKRFL